MNKKYRDYIIHHFSTIQDCFSRCAEATRDMKKTFPELIICRGFVTSPTFEKQYAHWWLKDIDGEIIDPTRMQFGGHSLTYEEIDENHDACKYERKRCHNCGQYYYLKPGLLVMHNQQCNEEYAAYLNGKKQSTYNKGLN